MESNMLFIDKKRQRELYDFYEVCQMHRNCYRGYPKAKHRLDFFKRRDLFWHSPPELTGTYLTFPHHFVQYKNPPVLYKENELDETFTPRFSLPSATAWRR